MTCIRVSLFALMATGLLLAPLSTGADVRPLEKFKGGGVIAPESPHQSIRLDSQEVIIRLGSESYVVDIVFNLFNTGGTTTEWTGFPKWAAPRTDSLPTFMRFEGSVNGRQIPFHEELERTGDKRPHWNMSLADGLGSAERPLKTKRQWLVSKITFPGHPSTTIRVRYEAPYYGSGISIASYLYGTGSLWKGNIGKAVFIVDSTEVRGTRSVSARFEDGSAYVKSAQRPLSHYVVEYELRDFEPHPEAYFWVSLSGIGLWQRQRPVVPPPPPMPVRIKRPVNE